MTDEQCARCGSSVIFEDCERCGCEGFVDDELEFDYEVMDYDIKPCPDCRGRCGYWRCLSTPEWCQAHPLQGREDVARGTIEFFQVADR